ncbi:class II glutamine amidotransferase, partial [candidate division KSB1 bacterium]|nr:class II glutamine amidotransferase [candidate division KSB1 bacterium]
GKLQVIKSTAPFYDDEKVEELKSIKSPLYILHARRKSPGKGLVRIENVHPFAYADYLFCHNGTINDALEFDQQFTPTGDTDSERFFYYILSDLNGLLHEKILFEKYSKINDFSAMNSFLTDGRTSYVINWYSSTPGYYTLKMLEKPDAVIVSSEILGHLQHENWKKLNNQDTIKIDTSKIKAVRNSFFPGG